MEGKNKKRSAGMAFSTPAGVSQDYLETPGPKVRLQRAPTFHPRPYPTRLHDHYNGHCRLGP